jgi:hypothetical protein
MGLIDIVNTAFYNNAKVVSTQNKPAIASFVAKQTIAVQKASNKIMTSYIYAQPMTQRKIGLVRGYITATLASKAAPMTSAQKTAIVQASANIQTSKTNLTQQAQKYAETVQTQQDILKGNLAQFQAEQSAAAWKDAVENPATASGIDWMGLIPMIIVVVLVIAAIGVLKK